MNLTINLSLDQLPGAYSINPAGNIRLLEEPIQDSARTAVYPGCEDPTMLESARSPGSDREILFNPWAERDEALNPLGTQFLGRPVFGTVAILPPSLRGAS